MLHPVNDTDILVCFGKLKVLLKKTPFPATLNPPSILLPPQFVIKCFASELVCQYFKSKLSIIDKAYIGLVKMVGIGGIKVGKQSPLFLLQ